MPNLTPKMGIKKPLGNETVNRATFNENWDIIDENAVSQADFDAHTDAPILDHADGSVTDAKIGDRTIDDTIAASTGADTPTRLWSKLANMIKRITGQSNWYTPPSTTLESANTHINATIGVHGATSAATANTLVQRDPNGRFKATPPSTSDEVARKAETDAALSAAALAQSTANAAFQSASDGKSAVAAAITGMGQSASGSDTFSQLASKISAISTDSDAAANEVLTGKTFYQGGAKRTGTMPNNGTPTWTPGTTNQGLSAGYYSGGTIAGDASLVAGNIKSGFSIFGVPGSVIQASGNAGAAQVLTGYSASNASGGFIGSMPNNGAPGWVPTTFNQFLSAGYYAGGTVYGSGNLVASNIRSGVDLFGVIGSLVEGRPWAQGNTLPSSSTITVTGLSFLPVIIIGRTISPGTQIAYISTSLQTQGSGMNSIQATTTGVLVGVTWTTTFGGFTVSGIGAIRHYWIAIG